MSSLRPFILPGLILIFTCAGFFRLAFPERSVRKARLKELRKSGKSDEARTPAEQKASASLGPEDALRVRRARMVGFIQLLLGAVLLWKVGLTAHWTGGAVPKWSDGGSRALHVPIEKHCEAFVQRGESVGLVVAAVSGTNHTVMAIGRPCVSEGKPAQGDTLFEIGSITKVFTGIALAKQINADHVRLDQPVIELLPGGVELPEPVRGVTLRQLTTHTAGFPRMPGRPRVRDILGMLLFGSDPYAGIDEARFRGALRDVRLESKPGTRLEYSNFSTSLLGWLLAHQAGTNYDAFIQREVCQPLGMKDSSIALTAGQRMRFAHGYRATLKVGPLLLALRSSPWDLPNHLAGAGGIRSTGADMLTFLEANMHPPASPVGRAIRDSHRELFRENSKRAIGMNWIRSESGRLGQAIIWHNGGTGGFTSFLGFTEDGSVGALILCNTAASVDELGMSLLRDLAGQPEGSQAPSPDKTRPSPH